jgi:2-aminoethylphosphonate-pyruvate transaminase
MIGSLSRPPLLIATNGAYGERLVEIATRLGLAHRVLRRSEVVAITPADLDEALHAWPEVRSVLVVHSETTTGLLNPVPDLAAVVAQHGKRLFVDMMSSFGAIDLPDLAAIEAVAASANKCLEGAPGLAFVLARPASLRAAAGRSISLVLDLADQWARLEKDGQFRFTPPTHVLAALDAALDAHAAEGGVAGRGGRYAHNRDRLCAGLDALGFSRLLPDALQGPIIVTIREPEDPRWSLPVVYDQLVAAGFAIYPGKLTSAATFRVGCIGQVFSEDLDRFLAALAAILDRLGITLPTPTGTPALES